MQFHQCVFRKQQRIKGRRGISTALATLSAFVVVRQTQANGLTHFWLKWHSQYLFKPCGAGGGGEGEGRGATDVKCKNATDLQSHLQISLSHSLFLSPSLRVFPAALLDSVVKFAWVLKSTQICGNLKRNELHLAVFQPHLPSSLLPSSADKTRKLQRINFTAYISSKSNSYNYRYIYVWVCCHKCWLFFSTLSYKTSQLAASLLPCAKYDFSFYLTTCQSRQFANLSMPVYSVVKGILMSI